MAARDGGMPHAYQNKTGRSGAPRGHQLRHGHQYDTYGHHTLQHELEPMTLYWTCPSMKTMITYWH